MEVLLNKLMPLPLVEPPPQVSDLAGIFVEGFVGEMMDLVLCFVGHFGADILEVLVDRVDE